MTLPGYGQELPVYTPLQAHHTVDYRGGLPPFNFDIHSDTYQFDLQPYIDKAMRQIDAAVEKASLEHLIAVIEAQGYTVTRNDPEKTS